MADYQEFQITPRGETLPTTSTNRVLVLGSRLSGAFELGEDFQNYLEQRGIPEPHVEVQRDAGWIEKYVLGRETVDEGRLNPNLPKGVILLPEMRQYTPTGSGMSLDTYSVGISNFVEQLCEKYGVPLIEIREYESPKQVMEGIRQLLEKPQEE